MSIFFQLYTIKNIGSKWDLRISRYDFFKVKPTKLVSLNLKRPDKSPIFHLEERNNYCRVQIMPFLQTFLMKTGNNWCMVIIDAPPYFFSKAMIKID